MSDHDDLDFNSERLRSVDRPIPPSPDADQRIRTDMLAAFDQVVERGDRTGTGSDTDDVDDMGTLRLVSDGDEVPTTAVSRRWSRSGFYLAAAALAIVVAVAALLTQGDGDGSTDLAERNAVIVGEFCDAIDADVENVAAFLADSSGERGRRALVSLEVLAQSYLDTATTLSGDDIASLEAVGSDLVAAAAEARAAEVRAGDPDADELRALGVAVADAIDQLPSSGGCRTDRLRGS